MDSKIFLKLLWSLVLSQSFAIQSCKPRKNSNAELNVGGYSTPAVEDGVDRYPQVLKFEVMAGKHEDFKRYREKNNLAADRILYTLSSISPNTALTAAHNFFDIADFDSDGDREEPIPEDLVNLIIRTGLNDLGFVQDRVSFKVLYHEDFSTKNFEKDFALVIFSQPIFTHSLVIAFAAPKDRELIKFVGYGATKMSRSTGPADPGEKRIGFTYYTNQNQIAALEQLGSSDANFLGFFGTLDKNYDRNSLLLPGDSGGPFLMATLPTSTGKLIGVASSGRFGQFDSGEKKGVYQAQRILTSSFATLARKAVFSYNSTIPSSCCHCKALEKKPGLFSSGWRYMNGKDQQESQNVGYAFTIGGTEADSPTRCNTDANPLLGEFKFTLEYESGSLTCKEAQLTSCKL